MSKTRLPPGQVVVGEGGGRGGVNDLPTPPGKVTLIDALEMQHENALKNIDKISLKMRGKNNNNKNETIKENYN